MSSLGALVSVFCMYFSQSHTHPVPPTPTSILPPPSLHNHNNSSQPTLSPLPRRLPASQRKTPRGGDKRHWMRCRLRCWSPEGGSPPLQNKLWLRRELIARSAAGEAVARPPGEYFLRVYLCISVLDVCLSTVSIICIFCVHNCVLTPTHHINIS